MNTPARRRPARRQAPSQPSGRVLSIRMYDVGFGDCFLLQIPRPDGQSTKVLFDCGTIKSGARPLKDVVKQVMDDLRAASVADGKPRIDVLVATHRHADHISGFADPGWAGVEVCEVWMPWTEKPDDAKAAKIRELHKRLAAQLTSRLGARLQASADPAERLAIDAALQLALNAASNEGAMRTLRHGFAGTPVRRYLPEEQPGPAWFSTSCLPGVTVHVLGPSRDMRIIRELTPPAGQSYLKLIDSGDDGMEHRLPFGLDWRVSPADFDASSDYQNLAQDLPSDERGQVRQVGSDLEGAVAAALDKALNGSSLVLVLQVGSATLLFSGDAQWGSWQIALNTPDYRKLLGEACFYKVGHHGSHNATPVEFVEKVLSKDALAMVSTGSVAQWPKVPKPELLQQLGQKVNNRIARSDQPQLAPAAHFGVDTARGVIEALIPF